MHMVWLEIERRVLKQKHAWNARQFDWRFMLRFFMHSASFCLSSLTLILYFVLLNVFCLPTAHTLYKSHNRWKRSRHNNNSNDKREEIKIEIEPRIVIEEEMEINIIISMFCQKAEREREQFCLVSRKETNYTVQHCMQTNSNDWNAKWPKNLDHKHFNQMRISLFSPMQIYNYFAC